MLSSWPPLKLERYQQLREAGLSAEELSRVAGADGLGMIETICLICRLFSLPLTEAKELVHVARFGAAEYQAHIGAVVAALEDVGKVLDHEAQIGRQLTEDEAEAFLHGIAAES